MSPEKGYKPNASRGKDLFSKRGCLACHSHEAFPETHADFGPDLSRVHGKLRPGQDGFRWLYSWVRDPQRYHRRTRMPNTFLETYDEGGEHIDPAADIAAFLFQKGAEKFPRPTVNQKDLDDLVMLHLAKTLKFEDAKKVLETRKYPVPKAQVRGDEIELIADANTPVSDGQWQVMRLNYVGRRTISRYGCYGCHDIPNFELARPIGTALQDWGRKDTSRLAPEHIDEYLEHHGEPNPAHPSTHDRIVSALKAAAAGGTATGMFKGNQEQTEMRAAYYYNDLIHHGRAGFFWQKLRDPRSYDYEKIQTKGYDERLRMPQFPFNEEQIEAIATFVLGLVADPPAKEYLYRPDGAAKARIEGERMIDRFNCSGCHMLEMPKIRYGADPGEITASLLSPADQPASLDLLLKLKPPDKAVTHMTVPVKTAGGEKRLPVVQFEGLIYGRPDPADPPEEQEYAFDLWDTLDVNGKIVFPSSRMLVKRTQLVSDATLKDGYATPPRGGSFAEWLVERMMATVPGTDRGRAWQMGPPPLYKEGTKVQTPWLYQFIREPYRLRHTTVLRMPRFNMSAEEAQTLANYFPAMDGSPFPYQKIAERDPEYLAGKEKQLKKYLGGSHQAYLADSWKALNANACIKCHSLAGRQVKIGDPVKDIRGPDLEYVTDRLRPDWLLLWLYNPKWITPYTSMPQAFAKNQPPKEGELAHLFGADPELQVIATRDALMNYHRLMEEKGTAEGPSASPPAAPAKKVSSSTSNKSSARGQE
jgi:mono/diheme cytochrome c family protein